MMKKTISQAVMASAAGVALLASGCTHSAKTSEQQYYRMLELETGASEQIPRPMREFRAAWVATVANIDWPSEPGLSTREQQDEAIAILDRAEEMNLNAIIFQVRPHADALYESSYEPWSHYLTGTAGQPPQPYYDPLQFWVEEAHERGIQLHAWFNPYRAHHPSASSEIPSDHVVNAHPDWVAEVGNYHWLIPTNEEAAAHSKRVMMEVATKYDVDGVHIDDYFYPYPSYNDNAGFPDDAGWQEYLAEGGELSREDWRRNAVDRFVEGFYEELRNQDKPVMWGISPFGIGKPGEPPQIVGFNQYEELYADAALWFREGWVDYYTPQLYWPINRTGQSYPVLLGWWAQQNHGERHLWPGNAIYRVEPESEDYRPLEMVDQVMVTRGIDGASGNVYFSMKHLMEDAQDARGNAAGLLKERAYQNKALIPASPWLDDDPPAAPIAGMETVNGMVTATWGTAEGEEVPFLWVLYTKRDGAWSHQILPAGERLMAFELPPPDAVAVSAVDRTGNESELTVVKP